MNKIILSIIMYNIISLIPYKLLAYFLFYKKFRFSNFISISVILFINLFQITFLYYFLINDMDYRFIEFMFTPINILLYFILIKENPFKILFFSVFSADVIIIARALSTILQYIINIQDFYIGGTVSNLITLFISIPVLLILYKKISNTILNINAPELWNTIWLLPLTTTLIILMFTYDLTLQSIGIFKFVLARMLFMLSTFMIYGTLFHALISVKKQIILKERADKMNLIIEMYTTQYSMLQNHITETRKARHDLRQHINLLQSYIANDNKKALSDYLSLYGKSLPKDIKTGYCQNSAIDVILGWYNNIAEKNNIIFNVNVNLPQSIPIPDPTLCVLFGNLLENAIESCKQYDKNNKFIKVRASIIGESSVSITVDNSSKNKPIIKNGGFLSTKHKGIGYGTYSVKTIAEQYNGVANFMYSDNVFYASVFLNT